MTSNQLSTHDIARAHEVISNIMGPTPLQRNDRLSTLTGLEVYVKREDLTPVRSYKLRGAYYFMHQLDAEQRKRGVVAASAGNHAQGVAYACALLEVKGRIYLPTTTPRQKRDRIRALGGEFVDLVLTGDTFDDAASAAMSDAARRNAVLVPPFDHPLIMTGQATVAKEIEEQLGKRPDGLIVPVGGGGLMSGSIAYFHGETGATFSRSGAHRPAIFGVEPTNAASLAAALKEHGPTTLSNLDTFVDGAAVRRIGANCFAQIAAYKPKVIEVDPNAVCTEMLALYQVDGIIAEPAGALSSTGLVQQLQHSYAPGATVVVIISGGNNDVSRYGEILERSMIHLGLKHYFLVNFPQEPGALRKFLSKVLGPNDDIALFEYTKRNNRERGPAVVGIELGAAEDLRGLLERMQESGIQAERIDPDSLTYRLLT